MSTSATTWEHPDPTEGATGPSLSCTWLPAGFSTAELFSMIIRGITSLSDHSGKSAGGGGMYIKGTFFGSTGLFFGVGSDFGSSTGLPLWRRFIRRNIDRPFPWRRFIPWDVDRPFPWRRFIHRDVGRPRLVHGSRLRTLRRSS